MRICDDCGEVIKKWSSVTNSKGVFCKKCNGIRVVDKKRTSRMIELLESGKTLEEVGSIYKISRERVRQIVKKGGYISNVWNLRGRVIHEYRCNNCKKSFYRKQNFGQLFCSKSCFGEMAHKMIAEKGVPRSMVDKHRRFEIKKYKKTTIKTSDGKWKPVYKHRVIMEKHLGRKLSSNEHVHHKDGNGLNNEIDNLEILNPREHMKKHNTGWTNNMKVIYLRKIVVSTEEKNRILRSS